MYYSNNNRLCIYIIKPNSMEYVISYILVSYSLCNMNFVILKKMYVPTLGYFFGPITTFWIIPLSQNDMVTSYIVV